MKPENKAFLDDNRHYYDTLIRAKYMQGLTGHQRSEMLRVLGEEFQPNYIGDLWCPNCVAEMVRTLYREYDNWKTRNPDEVAPEPIIPEVDLSVGQSDAVVLSDIPVDRSAVPGDPQVKKVKARFPSNKKERK